MRASMGEKRRYAGLPVGCTYCVYEMPGKRLGSIAMVPRATVVVGHGLDARELCAAHARRFFLPASATSHPSHRAPLVARAVDA